MKIRRFIEDDVIDPLDPDHAGDRTTAPSTDGGLVLDRVHLATQGIFGFDPIDIRARSFVMLRSQLLNGFHRAGGRILAITSTQPGNGKTFVTANLAAAMSHIHPTILIDLDLRRPALGRRLGCAPEQGIDDYLAGDVSLARTGIRIAGVDLLLHAGRHPRQDSATLLAGSRMERLMASLRNRGDSAICLIDTPPILALDDAMLIARSVDGVVMVVEEGATRGAEITEALRVLGSTPIIGTVLNKSLSGDPLPKSYGAYYDLSRR